MIPGRRQHRTPIVWLHIIIWLLVGQCGERSEMRLTINIKKEKLHPKTSSHCGPLQASWRKRTTLRVRFGPSRTLAVRSVNTAVLEYGAHSVAQRTSSATMDSDLLSTASGRAGLKATLTLASEAVLRQVSSCHTPLAPPHTHDGIKVKGSL